MKRPRFLSPRAFFCIDRERGFPACCSSCSLTQLSDIYSRRAGLSKSVAIRLRHPFTHWGQVKQGLIVALEVTVVINAHQLVMVFLDVEADIIFIADVKARIPN